MNKILVLLLVFIATNTFAQFEDDDNRILNEFIIMLKPDCSIEKFLQQPAFVGRLTNKECLSKRMNIYLLERNTSTSAEDFLTALKANGNVKLAQFNHHVQPRNLVPNDTFFNLQWNMLNTGQSGGIVGADIDATDAWAINHNNITADGDTIVVAIVDGGFDTHHEDLNYFVNYNEIDSNGVDDDGNGYIDDAHGWNVGTNTEDVYGTSDPHSTHLAGIVGAIGNNAKGVAGVCWGVKILPIDRHSNIESDVVNAYDYVIAMRSLYNTTFGTKGAFIVSTNSSFGVNNGNPVDYPIWCAMYDSMGAEGILSAAATANLDIDVDTQHDMPTECPSKWLIAVTNTTRGDQLNTGAAYGKTNIDLGAPGTGIYSTTPLNTYGYSTGTSMASPHVAGAIAAMYAASCKGLIDAYHEHPDSISLLMKKYLLDGTQWNSSLNNITVTNGKLNLLRAITNLKTFNCDSCNFNIDVNKTPVTCTSANNGALSVSVENRSISNYNVLWSNGITAPASLNLEPGFYSVSVSDPLSGCERLATAELHNPDTITISAINIIPASGGNPGNITIVATAGNDVLAYSIDGINYQPVGTFSVPTNGNYTVYIRNSSNCLVQQNVIVSGIDELSIINYQLSIFPNPANDVLTVYDLQFAAGQTSLEIFDVTGRRIYETTPKSSIFNLQSSIFPNGIYFLQFGSSAKKFAVMH